MDIIEGLTGGPYRTIQPDRLAVALRARAEALITEFIAAWTAEPLKGYDLRIDFGPDRSTVFRLTCSSRLRLNHEREEPA
jgi:hypothetical protein